MNLSTVSGYMCPLCHDLHDFYEDAVDCCQESPPEVTRYECEDCETLHQYLSDAEACCAPEADGNLLIPEYLRRIAKQQLEAFGQMTLL